jgi:hypothetical protein
LAIIVCAFFIEFSITDTYSYNFTDWNDVSRFHSPGESRNISASPDSPLQEVNNALSCTAADAQLHNLDGIDFETECFLSYLEWNLDNPGHAVGCFIEIIWKDNFKFHLPDVYGMSASLFDDMR